MLSIWRHCQLAMSSVATRISPTDETRPWIIWRGPASGRPQERMLDLDQEGTVVSPSKDSETTKNFPALEWLAAMWSHIPNRGEQMVREYGDDNVSRGKRQEGLDDAIPCILKPQGHEQAFRKSRAKLIQQDRRRRSPGLPEMSGAMRIISVIEDLGGQDHPHSSGTLAGKSKIATKRSLPANPSNTPRAISSVTHADTIYGDPDYTWDEYIQSSRIVKKGVQERSVCIVLNNALLPGDSTNR